MPEVSKGAGRLAGPGESSIYPSDMDPSRETGDPLTPDGTPRAVEPDEALKRESALFEPGTGRKAKK